MTTGVPRRQAQLTRPRSCACSAHPFFGKPATQIARPQCFPPLGRGGGTACRQEHRKWCCHADRDHRRCCRACGQGPAAPAGKLDRSRRRHAQSDPDADAGPSPRSGDGGGRRHDRLVIGCAGSAGLRLSRGADAQRNADHLSHDHRSATAARRRRSRALDQLCRRERCAAFGDDASLHERDPLHGLVRQGRNQLPKPRSACARS